MLKREHLNNLKKKKILIIDITFIIVTFLLSEYYNYSDSTGLGALEDVGKYLICLIFLAIETLLFVFVAVSWIKQNKRK